MSGFYLYRAPAEIPGETAEVRPRIHVAAWAAEVEPLPLAVPAVTALTSLRGLDRFYWEPDGSFLWCGANPEWQLCGTLYEREELLWYADLQGRCTAPAWQHFCSALTNHRLAALWLAARRVLIPAELLPQVWWS